MEDNARLRNIYKLMRHRCLDPKYDKYNYYGGRGILICGSWEQSYWNFERWALTHGYANDLTLDRIDNNKGYSPTNCRWVSRKEQANNRSSNRMITYNGKTQSLAKWADELGINYETLSNRIRAGWDIVRAFTEEKHDTNHHSYITYKGRTQRICEWAKELGMNFNTLKNRITFHHWPVEKAIETPVRSSCHSSNSEEVIDNE